MRFRLRDLGDRRPARPPDWPVSTGRPRVLVEAADGAVRVAVKRILDAAGYEVAGCGGPEAFRGGACPLVEEGRCSLAEGADVILNSLGLGMAESCAVLAAVRERVPDTPVVVEVPQPQLAYHRDELAGCWVALCPMTSAGLRERVHAALDAPDAQVGRVRGDGE
jgi:hypothetical protein